MTTIAEPRPQVTGGVDTHLDVHVAAVLSAVGGVLGTAEFPTTAAGYRQLVAWMRSFGDIDRVGVEGTGSYGVNLARHLREQEVTVIEVMRPNRQVRRRYGKTDVVDAIAAARAVLSGEATATPKTHDGAVEALRALKVLQRSATKARTQAINQLRSLLVTAPDELRARLRDLSRRELLATCANFRVAADDDSLPAITRLALRELAQRTLLLQEQLTQVRLRLARITAQTAPDLVALKGVGLVPALGAFQLPEQREQHDGELGHRVGGVAGVDLDRVGEVTDPDAAFSESAPPRAPPALDRRGVAHP